MAAALLTVYPIVAGQEIAASERVIKLTENGLLQITDILSVGPSVT
ncbi:MAG: hypothetical protein QW756_00200 [Nitrososphaerota archaeon]